jgi:hypothetical protein
MVRLDGLKLNPSEPTSTVCVVGIDIGVGVGVGATPVQPLRAAFTAAMISAMAISPLPSLSPAEQSETGALPRAMFTMTMSSATLTSPLPSQSPGHDWAVATAAHSKTVRTPRNSIGIERLDMATSS